MLTGSINNNGHQYNYQQVNPEDPFQAIKITCFFNIKGVGKVELKAQDIKMNEPGEYYRLCFHAAHGIYSDLKNKGKQLNKNPFGRLDQFQFFSEHADFIYNKVIKKAYLHEALLLQGLSPKMSPNGDH
ncbi:hypothetical protein [Endozoicomonas sp. ALB115]|uniref:hypothetical protein n=1 Tax=Endozoicomonas sp. ALB115 TaxID=3403074 RepID=UPI003BB61619